MDLNKLNNKLKHFVESFQLNEISDELKNKVINTRKQQLADLEKDINNINNKYDVQIDQKQKQLDRYKKHKEVLDSKAPRPLDICEVNGVTVTLTPVKINDNYYEYKITNISDILLQNAHKYDVEYLKDEGSSSSSKLIKIIQKQIFNNLDKIKSLKIISRELKMCIERTFLTDDFSYEQFKYNLDILNKYKKIIQLSPDIQPNERYLEVEKIISMNNSNFNESFQISEISQDLLDKAKHKATQNMMTYSNDLKQLKNAKKVELEDKPNRILKLRQKITDLEGMKDKKDIEYRNLRRNYTQQTYTNPEQDEKIAKNKLRAVKDELPRQFGDCKYFLQTQDEIVLKYNPTSNKIEVWYYDDYDDKYKKGGFQYAYYSSETGVNDSPEEYKYDDKKSTIQNIYDILQDVYNNSHEIRNDMTIDTYDNEANVSGIKILWRDYNELNIQDPKTYNIAYFIIRYHSDKRYRFI